MESARNEEATPNPEFQNTEEYIEKLKKWLDDARLWQSYCLSGSPIYQDRGTENTQNSGFSYNFPNQYTQFRPNANQPNQNGEIVFRPGTYELAIPPIWKRLVADIMDFIILFVIRMFLTFILVESFHFVTVQNYGFDTFEKYLQNPKMAMQMSVEILFLELLHRFIVCCYEVYWLRGGRCATPGKIYMGLMVVQVDTIMPVPGRLDDLVRVNPCSNLGIQRAILRALLKNLFVWFMVPIYFTMYIFRYNRTGYDMLSKSLVVEYNPNLQPID